MNKNFRAYKYAIAQTSTDPIRRAKKIFDVTVFKVDHLGMQHITNGTAFEDYIVNQLAAAKTFFEVDFIVITIVEGDSVITSIM